MNEQEKTTKEMAHDNQPILEAISALTEKFDGFKKEFDGFKKEFDDFKKDSEVQFEAIRQGIVANNAAFDRMDARLHDNRSDVLRLRAYITEFAEEMRQNARETLV